MIRRILRVGILLGIGQMALAAEVKHPNLFLNRQEIEDIKTKVRKHDWAARLFDKVQVMAAEGLRGNVAIDRNLREMALCYAITGNRQYAKAVCHQLAYTARAELPDYEKVDLKATPDFGAWAPLGHAAWSYDLVYDAFADQKDRELIERWLRTAARTIIAGEKLWTTTPNLVFDKHWRVAVVGYCLGDAELIQWGLNDPGMHGAYRGGFYPVLDTMFQDRHFWGEAPIYALHYDLNTMLALAEAARRYDGTDLYGHESNKSGGSLKNFIDGYLRMAYPLEKTGVGQGSVRLATFGDGSTSFSPIGEMNDTFLVNPVSRNPAEPTLSGELELAFARYRDPGYAWLLHLNPARDAYIGYGRACWGYVALTHGQPLPDNPAPPPAPSGVYPSIGFAMIRADESPKYWTSGSLAAVVRLGGGLGHGHNDQYELLLHGRGRLLYPDVNVIQYEPPALNWTHEGIAHNTLLVDHQSPQPGRFTTRHEFAPEAKFFAITGSAFPGVVQSRALLMTREYIADVFTARDEQNRPHVFDWVMHGLGRLYPGEPSAYRASDALLAHYWWVDREHSRATNDPWQADWIQNTAGVPPKIQRFSDDWFQQTAGVRLTMLGAAGTRVFTGHGPMTDGPPYARIEGNPEGQVPLVIARRRAAATTFAAVHEPYDQRSAIQEVRRIQETAGALGIAVECDTFSDRALFGLDSAEVHQLVGADGERFAFGDHGYLRRQGRQLAVRGNVKAFKMRCAPATEFTVTVNGSSVSARRTGNFLEWGGLEPAVTPSTGAARPEDASVKPQASLHYYLMPEELHLRSGGTKNVSLHVRCVGTSGDAGGALEFRAPREITVEPATVELPTLRPGETRVVPLRVKAADGAPSALHSVAIEPVGQTSAAAATVTVSVGVVITQDRRIPRTAQSVVRAPGYTMTVDHNSGVAYHLLDGDGRRRHGRIHNTNFTYGIPAVQRDGKWAFRYRHPCQFVWPGPNNLTVAAEGTYQEYDLRLSYTFDEDRIRIALAPPTNPTVEHTLWMGNFDALDAPLHNGAATTPSGPVKAEWFFFSHPVYRQGLLVRFAQPTPLTVLGTAMNWPARTGQEVSLQFLTREDLPAVVGKVPAATAP